MNARAERPEVIDACLPPEKAVVLRKSDIFRTAVERMSERRLGFACIVDDENFLEGVFTDGDIRRLLLGTHKPVAAMFADDIGELMTRHPKTIRSNVPLDEAVHFMESSDVYDLPVVDPNGKFVGVLHMHTALRHLLGP